MIDRDKLYELCMDAGFDVGLVIEELGGLRMAVNEDKVFSSASIIKLNILWAAYSDFNTGRKDPDDRLRVDSEDFVDGSGALRYLKPGHMFSIRDLCVMMIILSDNTATNMLIDLFGMDRINKGIADCGLRKTVLNRKMLDMQARERGDDNFTSPADAVDILKMIDSSDQISPELRKDMIEILLGQSNKRNLPHLWPEQVQFAHKTGELPDVLHDVGILYGAYGCKYYISVMTSGFSNRASGLRFINELGLRILNGINNN